MRKLLRALALTAALGSVTFHPEVARAHRGSAKFLTIERTEDGARVEVELEVVDAAVELGLGEDAAERDVLARSGELRRWVERAISMTGSAGPCRAAADAPRALDGEDGPPRLALTIAYACPAPVRDLSLRDDAVFATDAQHEAFVRLRFTGEEDAQVLRAGRQEIAVGEPPSIPALLLRFLVEGVRHLLTGYDHLLFLLSLVLTAGGLANRSGMRPALRDVAIVVTSFTVGHSVTLIAAALGVIVLPSRLVEATIAGSIAVVAIVNIVRPEARQGMPGLALGFGLVHGLGFSSVLAELGLPTQARVLALLSFNVGIELAQLVFVALALYPLAWLAGTRGYRTWVVQGGSGAIAILALVWLFERATSP